MFDHPAPSLERTRGEAVVALGPTGAPLRLRQAGSAKAFLPRVHGTHPEVVFLNTAGGLTGGDRLAFTLRADSGRVTGTTQTAERAYDAGGGIARMDVGIEAGPGARIDWLPQETILFDGAGLHRETEVTLAPGAEVLMCEVVILGRAAMGERVRRLDFRDRRVIRRGAVPVLVEPLALASGDLSSGPAGLECADGPARALAMAAFVARGAEDALGPVRALLDETGVAAHASAWDGRVVMRAMAADARPLRRVLARVVARLRGAPLPRVWQV